MDVSSKVNQLLAFRERDKFSVTVWNNRGLNPSSDDVCFRLTTLFNDCANHLITAVEQQANNKQLKAVLKDGLSQFNKQDYDTEERELICDTFYELAQLVNIDLTDTLNRWLYGSALSTLLKIKAAIHPKKVIETLSQECPTCGGTLETHIISRERGIPDFSWNIVQCKRCRDYSLISVGAGVKEMRFGNYDLIEQLPKEDFSKEQADIRLEQIKHFRK